jgi:predicted RNase H-like HicB family nuclease
MRIDHRYEIIIYWRKEDNKFIAEVPELPGCMAGSNSRLEVLKNTNEVISRWIEAAKSLNRPIPEPKGEIIYA